MNNEIPETKGKHSIAFVFECFMSVFYVAIGVVLLLTTILDYAFPNSGTKYVIGSLFGIYGIYRVFRSWNRFRNRNRE
jgi:hypothetical protein